MNKIENQKTALVSRRNNSDNSVNSVKKIRRLVPLFLDWFAANARDLPWRRTRDPYAIWVSEIMLQQTQVKTVIPFWNRWMRELPTVESAANAPSAKIHKLWEGLGYYTRVRNLQKAAKQIVSSRRDESPFRNKIRDSQSSSLRFPKNFEDVLALPGIGRYTAGAIGSIAFNQAVPILDGNVIRVLTRIFGIAENPKAKETNARLWQLAEELVAHAKIFRWGETPGEPAREDARPTDKWNCSHFNQSLMELGALVCTPRQPQCVVCPVKKLCVAFKESRTEELPNLGKRAAATARHFMAFVVERDGKFMIRQRPAGGVNAQLWEFPNTEVTGAKPDARDISEKIIRFAPPEMQPLVTVKHAITRYRITLEVFWVKLANRPRKTGSVWKTPAEMQTLAFTSAHRKILRTLDGAGLT